MSSAVTAHQPAPSTASSFSPAIAPPSSYVFPAAVPLPSATDVETGTLQLLDPSKILDDSDLWTEEELAEFASLTHMPLNLDLSGNLGTATPFETLFNLVPTTWMGEPLGSNSVSGGSREGNQDQGSNLNCSATTIPPIIPSLPIPGPIHFPPNTTNSIAMTQPTSASLIPLSIPSYNAKPVDSAMISPVESPLLQGFTGSPSMAFVDPLTNLPSLLSPLSAIPNAVQGALPSTLSNWNNTRTAPMISHPASPTKLLLQTPFTLRNDAQEAAHLSSRSEKANSLHAPTPPPPPPSQALSVSTAANAGRGPRPPLTLLTSAAPVAPFSPPMTPVSPQSTGLPTPSSTTSQCPPPKEPLPASSLKDSKAVSNVAKDAIRGAFTGPVSPLTVPLPPTVRTFSQPTYSYPYPTASNTSTGDASTTLKPHRCAMPGCGKTYQTRSGLRYHYQHRHPGHIPPPPISATTSKPKSEGKRVVRRKKERS